VADLCEHGKEVSCSMNCGINKLRNYQFLKKSQLNRTSTPQLVLFWCQLLSLLTFHGHIKEQGSISGQKSLKIVIHFVLCFIVQLSELTQPSCVIMFMFTNVYTLLLLNIRQFPFPLGDF
jgi:hypothetical protein